MRLKRKSYRIESPSGEPIDTLVFMRLENGNEVIMPDITKVTWSVDANGTSRAIIEVIGVKIGRNAATSA